MISAIAVEDFESLNLSKGFLADPVGSQSFNLYRNGRFRVVGQCDRHESRDPLKS